MTDKPVRHILGLSGGKDSAALAVFMRRQYPDLKLEYFFCDTGQELEETYDFLERLEARLNITIQRLQAERGFDHWLDVYGGLLPSPKMRWCTKQLKIAPLEQFVGDDHAVSYIGIRADEEREGYISTKPNITARFPFREHGLAKADVVGLLEESGIGMPGYYRWRSRSGCSFCFYQRKIEWVRLHDEHPKEFWAAVAYEENHKDGRRYTWSAGETLRELLARRDAIEAENEKAQARRRSLPVANASLLQVLGGALDAEDDDSAGCTVCHI
ncbi:MAG: phosphoadenosine phosphosulfate reductase family protein [Pseudomonadota bacterium]|jgi:hypothetical protein